MNLIRIAGHVVNMDNVLYVEYGKRGEEDFVMFNFPGRVHTVTDNQASDNTTWYVTGADAVMFIRWLEQNSQDVAHKTTTHNIKVTPTLLPENQVR